MSTTMDIRTDPEIRALVPPLSPDERSQLEANLLAEGCRDPLVTWRGTLLDGHNRKDLCEQHGIAYETVEVDLPDRNAALVWIIHNQLGRRNLTDFARGELALKLKPLIAAKAKAKQQQSGGAVPQKSAEPPVETREAVARAAGVSHDTLRKVEDIAERSPEPVKAMLRQGDVSINAAHTVSTLPAEDQAEIAAAGPEAVREKARELRESKAATNGHAPARSGQTAVESADPEDDAPALENESQAGEDEGHDPGAFDLSHEDDEDSKAERAASRWDRFFDGISTFLVSMPRRGGIVRLTRGWSRQSIVGTITKLEDLGNAALRCAAELKEAHECRDRT